MIQTRYRICANKPLCFLACTIIGWLPVFTRPETVQIVLDSWHFLQAEKRLTLYGYVILENHLHLIASSPDLSKEIKSFKSFTARQIIDLLKLRQAMMLLDQLEWRKAGTRSRASINSGKKEAIRS